MTKNRYLPWLYLLPALGLLITFTYVPVGNMLFYSFHSWDGLDVTMEPAGLDNYVRVLTDERYWRVFLISLDGLGYEAFHSDPAASELTAVRKIAAEGVEARGMTSHFPSTTANGHAAIWTGMWGDRNGISGNSMPALKRAEHTFLERVNGYRSDALRGQPLWVTAASSGLASGPSGESGPLCLAKPSSVSKLKLSPSKLAYLRSSRVTTLKLCALWSNPP